MRTVTFTGPHGIYFAGDEASFPEAEARALVAAGKASCPELAPPAEPVAEHEPGQPAPDSAQG